MWAAASHWAWGAHPCKQVDGAHLSGQRWDWSLPLPPRSRTAKARPRGRGRRRHAGTWSRADQPSTTTSTTSRPLSSPPPLRALRRVTAAQRASAGQQASLPRAQQPPTECATRACGAQGHLQSAPDKPAFRAAQGGAGLSIPDVKHGRYFTPASLPENRITAPRRGTESRTGIREVHPGPEPLVSSPLTGKGQARAGPRLLSSFRAQ